MSTNESLHNDYVIQLRPAFEVDIQICQPERGYFPEGLPEGKQPVKG